MSTFEERKSKILEALSQPLELYTDASPKGSVDEGIREFVDEINRRDGFVTTSSCAGRIAVYQAGSSALSTDNVDAATTSAGGKGGGQWLFVSHDPVRLDKDMDVFKLLSLPYQTPSLATPGPNSSFIHLKFEPMILHVLCSNLSNARKLLGAALSSGFRESGISSISDNEIVLVAVRTNGLAFDCIIAYMDEAAAPTILVSEPYLCTLISVGNQRFEANQARTARFRSAFLRAITTGAVNDDWEPADERRARKRAEGLARRQQSKHNDGSASVKREQEVLDEEVGFTDLLGTAS